MSPENVNFQSFYSCFLFFSKKRFLVEPLSIFPKLFNYFQD